MTVHQIVFRLNDENPHDAAVLDQLAQYPYENNHQAAKAIVWTFAKQGLVHPGSNPSVAQEFYPGVYNQPTMGYSTRVETPHYVEPAQPIAYDSDEPVYDTSIQADTPGMEPISFDFGAC